MSITEFLKGTQEMKTLHEDLKAVQINKQESNADNCEAGVREEKDGPYTYIEKKIVTRIDNITYG